MVYVALYVGLLRVASFTQCIIIIILLLEEHVQLVSETVHGIRSTLCRVDTCRLIHAMHNNNYT